MHITFSPVRSDAPLTISVAGDVLTINGEEFDFSPLLDGELLPNAAVASDFITSDVERLDGKIHLTLLLPHGARAPESVRFMPPLTITSGELPLSPNDPEEPTDDEN